MSHGMDSGSEKKTGIKLKFPELTLQHEVEGLDRLFTAETLDVRIK